MAEADNSSHAPHAAQSSPEAIPVGLAMAKRVLLPGALVLAVVALGLAFVWMTSPGGDVDSLIERLAEEGGDRWPAAVSLAAALQDPSSAQARRDPAIAGRLSAVLDRELDRELDSGGQGSQEILLRMYLCRALGEFHVAEPLPVLLRAAEQERDEREVAVRQSALEALALLVSHLDRSEMPAETELTSDLLAAAGDSRAGLRQRAAFALGVLGGPSAEARLEGLLTDPVAEVRYNAATGLARHGNVAAVEVLREMLDPAAARSGQADAATVQINALRAIRQLAAANPEADLQPLAEPIRRFADEGTDAPIRVQATEALLEIGAGASTAP